MVNQEEKLYFLALIPDAHASQKIESRKLALKDQYGLSYALRLPAHITLQAPFKCPVTCEENMRKIIGEIAKKYEGFELQFQGFDHFDQRVLFADIAPSKALQEIHQTLQDALLQDQCLSLTQVNVSFHPHITLAHRDMEKELFPKLWDQFKGESFSDHFSVSNLVLFRHGPEGWELASGVKLQEKLVLK